jgi:carboxylesterase
MVALAVSVAALAVALLAWVRRRAGRATESRVDSGRRFGPGAIIAGAEPIRLVGGDRAVLLLHGFGDSPQSLSFLAQSLHDKGWTVRVPLLPGHGTTLATFARSTATEWIAAAEAALDDLEDSHRFVVLGGLSMGGAIATILAARRQHAAPLVLLAPYLSMPEVPRWIALLYPLSALFTLPYVDSRTSRSIHDPHASARAVGYGVTSPRLLRELLAVVRLGRAAAPNVRSPLLVVHSEGDHRIPPERARSAFALFGSTDRTLEWVSRSGHVLTVDYDRDRVADLVASWLESRAKSSDRPNPQAAQNPR